MAIPHMDEQTVSKRWVIKYLFHVQVTSLQIIGQEVPKNNTDYCLCSQLSTIGTE